MTRAFLLLLALACGPEGEPHQDDCDACAFALSRVRSACEAEDPRVMPSEVVVKASDLRALVGAAEAGEGLKDAGTAFGRWREVTR